MISPTKPEEVAEIARKYHQAFTTLGGARETLRDAEVAIKDAEGLTHLLSTVLLGTVEPRCGSATKPWRRLFYFGREVLIVEWDHKADRPVISVEPLTR